MFSTGGSTLSVEKIRPVETRAWDGVMEPFGRAVQQVVHIGVRGCYAAHRDTKPHEIRAVHSLVDQQFQFCPGHANLGGPSNSSHNVLI
jgi:hypothetical protein